MISPYILRRQKKDVERQFNATKKTEHVRSIVDYFGLYHQPHTNMFFDMAVSRYLTVAKHCRQSFQAQTWLCSIVILYVLCYISHKLMYFFQTLFIRPLLVSTLPLPQPAHPHRQCCCTIYGCFTDAPTLQARLYTVLSFAVRRFSSAIWPTSKSKSTNASCALAMSGVFLAELARHFVPYQCFEKLWTILIYYNLSRRRNRVIMVRENTSSVGCLLILFGLRFVRPRVPYGSFKTRFSWVSSVLHAI